MKGIAGLAFALAAAAALLMPGPAGAQMRPHRAEYTLRLGTALNATRIGTIVQDIELTCDGWRIRRELIRRRVAHPLVQGELHLAPGGR